MKLKKYLKMMIKLKTLLKIFFVLILIFSLFIGLKNIIVSRILEQAIEQAYGIEITVGDLDVSFTGSHARMEQVTIYNPAQFKKRELAFLPAVNLYFRPLEYFMTKKFRVYFLDLEIERLTIIKNQEGKINLKMLDELKKEKSNQLGHSEISKREPNKLEIDMFHLIISDVYYIDNTRFEKPIVRRYSLDFDQGFRNVDSFEDIGRLIAYNIISKTRLGKTLDITITPLAENIKDIAVLPGKVATSTLKSVFGLPFIFKK
ncbi:MAG: hypothetical protein K9L84_00015 [Candidatus Omnitrophica bacterium]|nr:hypothetical protein [Candidatus Omnitrophota bacterium]MCF7893435.1 hypothetical protein [Candidatus Omnitrophota bacterium]